MPFVYAYQVAKDELPLDQCEDAWASSLPFPAKEERDGRLSGAQASRPEYYAVSDGAGTAGFSKEWARALTRWAVDHPPQDFKNGNEWLRDARQRLYQAWVDNIGIPKEKLPYYGQNKFDEGSQATLVLIKLDGDHFEVLGAGDSCMLVISDTGVYKRSWPIERSSEFDTSPSLIHTSGAVWPLKAGGIQSSSGPLRQRHFLLVTDALAKWLLKQHEQQEKDKTHVWDLAWQRIKSLQNAADLKTWVIELVAKGELRNDDVTLVHIAPKMKGILYRVKPKTWRKNHASLNPRIALQLRQRRMAALKCQKEPPENRGWFQKLRQRIYIIGQK
jgi:hypothetical protein